MTSPLRISLELTPLANALPCRRIQFSEPRELIDMTARHPSAVVPCANTKLAIADYSECRVLAVCFSVRARAAPPKAGCPAMEVLTKQMLGAMDSQCTLGIPEDSSLHRHGPYRSVHTPSSINPSA